MEHEVFRKVYDENVRFLFDYAFKLTGDKDLAIDEIHDLFLYLYEKNINLTEITNPKAYLIISLRRRIFKSLQLKRNFDSDTDIPFDFQLEFSVEKEIIEKELNNETLKKLEEAFKELSPRQKEIIHLKYFENLSNDEIREAMNLSDQATRNLLSKTLRKLRESYPDTRIITLLLLS